ncbi:probable low-specificity L-threonine aldolase 2 [Lacerta agilis]|uniref:probable low-specificity L-threonine aldolase 2 n=1 Tax=Lacerta agilis TaxID=80427 RepID=UPI001419C3F2|nr:probable low-specificity L-threonine aldolase 2 [Lacerta agilis]
MSLVPALQTGGEMARRGGRALLCKELHARVCSCWAPATPPATSQGGEAYAPTSCKAGCPGFSSYSYQPIGWCKQPGAILSRFSRRWRGVGTTLVPSGHVYRCRISKACMDQLRPWDPCQGLGACQALPRCWYQGVGTLLSHPTQKGPCQTFCSSLAHPSSTHQPLSASLRSPWLMRILLRTYSQSITGQHCASLPWWPKQPASSLFPAPRVGEHSYHASRPADTECHVVDLRSDTVTQPSPEMRQAMAQAEVGDDDYGEDPTVNELQRVVADLLGMEGALFVPTATMANLIAVMCHCHRRGAQLLLGRESHIHVFEQGGIAQVAGIHSEALQDLPNGTISLDELEQKIQRAHQSQYHPRPELICLENTHSSAGGRVLPLKYLQEVHQLAQRYGLRVHMDGARVLNAAVALGVPPAHISQHCNSISLCLSKGVGAPAGALLVGSGELVAEAWRVRKLLGGGMRQAGVLAAAGLVGLSRVEETLKRDHHNARRFAQGAFALGSPLCSVNPATVETNIVMATVSAPGLTPAKLCELMEAVSAEEVAATGQAVSVRLFPWGERGLRAVWHCDVSLQDTQLAEGKWRFVLGKWEQQGASIP